MFSSCPDTHSNLLPYLYNIKNKCVLYNDNIIILNKLFQDYYMTLRDYLLNTTDQQIVYLSKNNSLFSAISFARSAYDCIADEIYGKGMLYKYAKKPEIIGEYVFNNGTYILTDRNNIPILVNCKDPANINYTKKYFKDRYYKNNFKAVDITNAEYNTCIDKIRTLPHRIFHIFSLIWCHTVFTILMMNMKTVIRIWIQLTKIFCL